LVSRTYKKMQLRPSYKYLLWILGLPVHIFVFLYYLYKRKNDSYFVILEETKNALLASGYKDDVRRDFQHQLLRKHEFYNEKISQLALDHQAKKRAEEKFQKTLLDRKSVV